MVLVEENQVVLEIEIEDLQEVDFRPQDDQVLVVAGVEETIDHLVVDLEIEVPRQVAEVLAADPLLIEEDQVETEAAAPAAAEDINFSS